MLFLGHALKKHGVYFQDALSAKPFEEKFLSQGYWFNESHVNQVVPFIKIQKGEFVVVDVK
jgi:hypothetical protein